MKYLILAVSAFVLVAIAHAQSYNPGLPLPGLPKSLGQKTMANSTSVTIASNQTPVSITGSITANNASVGANGSGVPGSSTQVGAQDQNGKLAPFIMDPIGISVSAHQFGPWDVRNITGTVTLPTGAATAANQTTIIANQTNATQKTQISDALGITVTVRQLGSQVISTDNGLVSNTVIHGLNSGGGGAYVDVKVNPSGSLEVNSNQGTSPWVVRDIGGVAITSTVTVAPVTVTSSTISRVANSASNQTLLNSNGSRKQIFLFNDSSSTSCYVKFGATASVTSFTVKMFATDTYIMDPPTYTGQVDYICDAASGNMEVNEQ